MLEAINAVTWWDSSSSSLIQTVSVSAEFLHPYSLCGTYLWSLSLENVSDGYGRNPVQVYVSILSIIQFNNLCTVLDMVKYFSALNLLTLCISFILRETGPPSINQTWLRSLSALYHLSLATFEKTLYVRRSNCFSCWLARLCAVMKCKSHPRLGAILSLLSVEPKALCKPMS